MDIPDLVRERLGDEEIQAGVSLGDEDAVCLTPTRTLVYRAEGLLSDEQVEEFSHDIEQLAVSEGRRKTKFTMEYIDGTRSFTVPADRGEKVLERFLEGVLRLDGIIESRESVVGVYRFSELTLVIAEGRLVKHVGNPVWSDDYEVLPYEDVTSLEFERASVATSIALGINGRPQRIKVPNDKARLVRRTLEQALFEYYDVDSLEGLDRLVGTDDSEDRETVDGAASGDDFEFGKDFDPLVSDDEEPIDPVDDDERLTTGDAEAGSSPEQPSAPSTEASGQSQGHPDDGADSGRATDSTAADEWPQGETTAEDTSKPASAEDTSKPASAEGVASVDTETSTDPGTDDQPTESAETAASALGEVDQTAGTEDTSRTESPSQSGTPTDPLEPTGGDQTAEQTQSTQTGGVSTGEAGTPGLETSDEDAAEPVDGTPSTTEQSDATGNGVDPEEFESLVERVEELTDAVDRQNELLKRQHRAIKQLVQQQQDGE